MMNDIHYYRKIWLSRSNPPIYSFSPCKSMSSRILFTHLVYPYILGWYAKLIFNFIPNALCNDFQNTNVKLESLSEMITLRNPCNLNISLENLFSTIGASLVVLQGIKCATLVNLSTTTRIESWWNLVFKKSIIKSIKITYHFYVGTSCGYKYPTGCWCSALTF